MIECCPHCLSTAITLTTWKIYETIQCNACHRETVLDDSEYVIESLKQKIDRTLVTLNNLELE